MGRTRRNLLSAFLLCATLGGPLCAQDVQMLPVEAHPEWTAIGRLNVIGYNKRRTCTASLIAPDRVLTAAHCVVFPDGSFIPPRLLRFVPGWLQGEYAAVGEVASVRGADAFARQTGQGRVAIAQDHAVLELTAPITQIQPLPVAEREARTPLRLLGYRKDRPHALSDSGLCDHTEQREVIAMECPATFGNSGGPVLQNQDGRWVVVGVVSAINQAGTTFASLPIQ